MQIRLARESDLGDIHRIAQALRIPGHPDCDWHHFAQIRRLITYRCFFVAVRDNTIVGFVCLERHLKTVEIVALAIASRQRGLGVGQKIIRFVARRAHRQGVSRVRVGTLSYYKAKEFYLRCGFSLARKFRWQNLTEYHFRATPRMLLAP